MKILLLGLISGPVYALLEFGYTSFFPKDKESGNRKFSVKPSKGNTTVAMIPGTIICTLFFMYPISKLLLSVPLNPFYFYGLQLLIWPIVIWIFEIIWGSYLYYACNNTRAWKYDGKLAAINHFVKWSYIPHWCFLGCIFTEIVKYFVI